MEDVEYSGRTVEDAITQAERDLGVARDSLSIHIITQGRGGVFGIGAEAARISARRLPQAEPEPEITLAVATGVTGVDRDLDSAEEAAYGVDRTEGPATAGTTRRTEPARNGEALAEEALGVLESLLVTMGIHADVSIRDTSDPLTLAINGDNLGVLIGRRGDNLAALQFMVNLILSKDRRQWPRVVVDVEDYRARREESLSSLADRIAYRVARNGRPFTLEAMPASDRRIIHLALRERNDIETYSIGEGPARRVVVAPKRPQRVPARPSD